MSGPVEDYLNRTGVSFKRTGGELVISCPECQHRKAKCFVNPVTWLWNCKHCDASGNEHTLKAANGHVYDIDGGGSKSVEQERQRAFEQAMAAQVQRPEVDHWRDALMQKAEAQQARDYLMGRCIPLEVALSCGVGWIQQPPGATTDGATGKGEGRRRRRKADGSPTVTGPGWLTIPSFARATKDAIDYSSVGVVKLRSVPPAKRDYRRIKGGESLLFAPRGINPNEPLVITGGEFDAMSCVAAGWDNVVSGTTGEGSWSDTWTRQLQQCVDIVVAYDNDDVGREGALKVARKLGLHRTRLAQWPQGHKDANDALQAGDLDLHVLEGMVAVSQCLAGEGVSKLSKLRDSYSKWRLQQHGRGRLTGWEDFDMLLNGLRGGEVTVVTGDTGSGKSTWVSDLVLRVAQGVPGDKDRRPMKTLMCPLELGPMRQLNKWVRQKGGLDPNDAQPAAVELTLDRLDALPIWVFTRYGGCDTEALRNTLLYAHRRLDVELVVLDHLHMAIEDTKEERQAIDVMMKMLAQVAVETGMHVIVVAHPSKVGSIQDKDRDNRIIQLGDLKGSSGIKQLADNVVSCWRPRSANREGVVQAGGRGMCVLYLLKVRDDSGQEGPVPLEYHFQSATYHDEQHGHIQPTNNTGHGHQAPTDQHWSDI